MAWIETVAGDFYNLRNVNIVRVREANKATKVEIETAYGVYVTVAQLDYTLSEDVCRLENGHGVPLEVVKAVMREVSLYITGVADSMMTIKQADIKRVIDKDIC